jgi:hypothetical protein
VRQEIVELVPYDSSVYNGSFKRFYTYEPLPYLELLAVEVLFPCNNDGSWPNRYLGVKEMFED